MPSPSRMPLGSEIAQSSNPFSRHSGQCRVMITLRTCSSTSAVLLSDVICTCVTAHRCLMLVLVEVILHMKILILELDDHPLLDQVRYVSDIDESQLSHRQW
ncbi:hypothetical protein KC19_1G311300 [Ceratodon purpureus]|uniref:Uncharacterized protein n=1 Tax=Ceratodon purpureus TaxID=3225 RepID=A0A8T0JDW7_CERPU|nr:hypothetical protein KC19_1G311300 [Ceratodon purpureus]